MKWTEQQTKELKDLCMSGTSNKDLAENFSVPVTEIHAKRSQLGITIPKVKAAQGKPGMTVNPEFEAAVVDMEKSNKVYNEERFARTRELDAKRNLLRRLESALRFADNRIMELRLTDEGKTVLIIDASGAGTMVNIEGDRLLAIIADVTRKCLF